MISPASFATWMKSSSVCSPDLPVRLPLLLLLAVVLAGLAPGMAAAETPAYAEASAGSPAELLSRETVLLARLEQLRALGRHHGPDFWPGWDLLSTPIAVFDPGRLVILIQHPNPPATFVRVDTPLVSTPVYVSTNTNGLLADTALPFHDVVTTMVSYRTLMNRDAEEALTLCLHTLFHGYQQRIAPQKTPDIQVVVFGRYPEFSFDNNALLSLEGALLEEALDTNEDRKMRAFVRRFLAVRAVRRRLLSPELARFERGEEADEGLARYIEYRFLSESYRSYAPLPALQRYDPHFHSFRHNQTLLRLRVDPLLDLALAGDSLRQRLYPLGMAQAVLLDRLDPKWKEKFEHTTKFLDELLADAVNFPSEDNVSIQSYYQRALQAIGINWELLQAQVHLEIAARTRAREALLAELFPPGIGQLEVDVSALRQRYHLHGVNPNSLLQFPDGRVLARFLVIDFGAGEECAVRVVNGAALFDPARNTYVLPVPADLLPQPDASFPLEIQTRTFNVHVEKGTILAAPNRRLIQAQPVPASAGAPAGN